MSKHFRFGGSTISRTLNCPAWSRLSDTLPKPPAGQAAELGTALHEIVLEKALVAPDYDINDAVGTTVNDILITQDHITLKVEPAVKAFNDLLDTYEADDFDVEVFTELTANVGGTLDFIAQGERNGQHYTIIADLKTGDGNMIDAKDNDQLMFYAVCAMHNTHTADMFKRSTGTLVLAIIQPSIRKKEVLDIWEIDYQTLAAFDSKMRKAIIRADNCDDDPISGAWCKFCPAEAICPAKTGLMEKARMIDPASAELKTIVEAMHLAEELESWVGAVKKIAYEQAELGMPISGYKLVNKRPIRVWTDVDAVEDVVKRTRKVHKGDAHEHKLFSPAKMEKLFHAKGVEFKRLEHLVASVSSGSVLVKNTDKRARIIPLERLKMLAR